MNIFEAGTDIRCLFSYMCQWLKISTCLLVKGKYYDGSVWTPGWYRVDFVEGKDSAGKAPGDAGFDPTKVSYMPILRNYKYSFTITAVNGKGFTYQHEACYNPGVLTGLRTELLTVDESGVKDYVYNGQNYLGVCDPIEILGHKTSTTTGTIVTDVYDGWRIDMSQGSDGITYFNPAGVPVGEPVQTGWITSANKAGNYFNQKDVINVIHTNNSGQYDRGAYIHIKAGRLSHKVELTQLTSDLYYTEDGDMSRIAIQPKGKELTGSDWAYVTKYGYNGNIDYPQGICPDGYRVPTYLELYLMYIYMPALGDHGFSTTHFYWASSRYNNDKYYPYDIGGRVFLFSGTQTYNIYQIYHAPRGAYSRNPSNLLAKYVRCVKDI